MTKFEVFSVPYFPVLSLNAGKNGPEKIPYLDTFQVVENLGFYQFITTFLQSRIQK